MARAAFGAFWGGRSSDAHTYTHTHTHTHTHVCRRVAALHTPSLRFVFLMLFNTYARVLYHARIHTRPNTCTRRHAY